MTRQARPLDTGNGYVWPWVRLVGCVIGIVLIWGWLLPAIGSRDAVRASIESMNERGIDPAAIFYTDVFQSPETGSATEFPDNR